jgi:DNA-binding MarR family transcriptional regulator
MLDIESLKVNNHGMELTAVERETDQLDAQLDVWTREIPALDRLTEGIVERIQKLARYFNQSMEGTLGESGLSSRAYWVLTRLRYQGPPYRLSAGQLAEHMGLSSGAMTNRLDRLEEAGLVRRVPDPDDRRGVLVEPTEKGHAAWDRATGTAASREALVASVLSESEKEELHSLLRRLMAAFPEEVREAARRSKAKAHADEED